MRKSVPVSLFLLVLALLLAVYPAEAKSKKHHHKHVEAPVVPADPIVGVWLTEDKDGGIEFYSCGTEICGRFYWLKSEENGGDISRDTDNPDPDKRNRPLCNMQFMGGFKPDGKGKYTDGWIYSPRHGMNFDAEMKLKDQDTLALRGFVLLPFFGSTQTWTRAANIPHCKIE